MAGSTWRMRPRWLAAESGTKATFDPAEAKALAAADKCRGWMAENPVGETRRGCAEYLEVSYQAYRVRFQACMPFYQRSFS
jgi:hypothetical protein